MEVGVRGIRNQPGSLLIHSFTHSLIPPSFGQQIFIIQMPTQLLPPQGSLPCCPNWTQSPTFLSLQQWLSEGGLQFSSTSNTR